MLSLQQLCAGYGASQVLRGVTLQVAAGELVCLLGRNGSGRSTLARAVMGLVRAQGRITWRGQNLLGLPAHAVARAGLGYVPESRDLFADLSVADNLRLGRKPGQRGGRWTQAQLLEFFPSLQQRLAVRAGALSGGEQQALALCRTLMGDPDLVLIDEPAEGLAPQWAQQVAALLQVLKQAGVGALLIEQRLGIALQVADRCLVLGDGRIVLDCAAAELPSRPQVLQEWLAV